MPEPLQNQIDAILIRLDALELMHVKPQRWLIIQRGFSKDGGVFGRNGNFVPKQKKGYVQVF